MAVAGRDHAKTSAFASGFNIRKVYTKYEDVANDPEIGKTRLRFITNRTKKCEIISDVVYIGTFNITHYEVVKLMLNHKKHVLCEKPITLLLKQTEELFALAKEQQKFLMEVRNGLVSVLVQEGASSDSSPF